MVGIVAASSAAISIAVKTLLLLDSISSRAIKQQDLSQILLIEKATASFPWTEQAHQDGISQSYPSLLLENNRQLLGFIIFNWYADECHLLNIVVNLPSQGKGYAKHLIKDMLKLAKLEVITKIILEVRASNQPALNLYLSLGFEQIGVRKNYYRGHLSQEFGREDAIVMQKAL